MSERKTVKTWTKTSITNLIRHKSGRYYARLFRGDKETWKALKTTVLEVAKNRLRDEQEAFGKQEVVAKPAKSGRMSMGEAIAKLEAQINAGVPMKKRKGRMSLRASSAHYRRQTIAQLRKSWQVALGVELDPLEVRRVTSADVRKWADSFRASASESRFNNTLGTLRRVFDVAIAAGERHGNPTENVDRSDKAPRATHIPSREQLPKLVAAIRAGRSRYSADAADYVEFLAYTGARKDEASSVLGADVDLLEARATFTKTKNGIARTVDLTEPALALLRRIANERGGLDPSEPVFRVSEAYGSLRAAAKAIGMPRISHHDLRDFFATTALESGINIPTVAEWLGHQDGGALLLQRYRKHRDEHSAASAKRVSFDPAPPAANVISMQKTA